VPVLLGDGIRLYDALGGRPVRLARDTAEPFRTVDLRYRRAPASSGLTITGRQATLGETFGNRLTRRLSAAGHHVFRAVPMTTKEIHRVITELNHLAVVVSDLDETLDFYGRLFGARKVWGASIGEPAKGVDIAYVQLAQGLVEFIASRPAGGMSPGLDHLGFHTDDLEGDYTRLTAAGYPSVLAPKASASGVGHQALVRDADGVLIELLQRDFQKRDATLPHPHILAIDHITHRSPDHDRSLLLYRDELGMSVSTHPPLTRLSIAPDAVELIPLTGEESAGLMSIVLLVDDLDAMLAFVVEQGVSPHGPSPASGGRGRIASIEDPDGIVIEFVDRSRALV